MGRVVGALALVVGISFVASPVGAATRPASIANYWFQDDATKDRKKIVVMVGDAITFTVVEGDVVPHTVEIDEFEVHSGALLQGQTFTTPKLTKTGTFRLYCGTHSEQGHAASLVVEPRAAKGSTTGDSSDEGESKQAAASSDGERPSIVLAPSTVPPGATPLQLPALTIEPGATAPERVDAKGRVVAPFAAGATVDTDRSLAGVWWLLGATSTLIAAGVLLLQRSLAATAGTTRSTPDRPCSSGRSAEVVGRRLRGSLERRRGRKR